MAETPWSRPRGVDSVVAEWQNSGAIQRCLAAERFIGERGG